MEVTGLHDSYVRDINNVHLPLCIEFGPSTFASHLVSEGYFDLLKGS